MEPNLFLNVFTEHFVVVVFVACLVLGYIIKHASFLKKVPNCDIPVILAVLGALINIAVSGVSIESAVYGAFMGLASTGAHQAFTRFLDNFNGNTATSTEPNNE